MSPFVRLVLIVAVAAVIWWALTAYRAGRATDATTFTPVEDLRPEVRQAIDAALARGELGGAVEHYRAATGAGSRESQAAVETHRWKSGA